MTRPGTPTSSASSHPDATAGARIKDNARRLQIARELTYIFISHDLSVVKFMSDMMCVMKDGVIVEAGPSDAIYANPQQAYTQDLIEAIPRDDLEHIRRRQADRLAAHSA